MKTPSLFAEPRKLIDVDEAEELLTAVLPDLDANGIARPASSKRGFVWLKREITPKQQQEIHRLGIPGVGFLTENKRVYPNGPVVSHVIGHVNIDNQGIAGIEKWLDGQGLAALHMAGLATDRLQRPVQLALDLRVQYALRDELDRRRARNSRPRPPSGVILNVNTGEIVAMVSEPDYDPNNPREANDPTRINRLTTGVYEMGSTFKVAHAGDGARLRQGDAQLRTSTRAHPLQYGKFTIHDFEPQDRFSDGAGNLHLFVQHRRRAHGAGDGRRRPQGVPEEDGPARPAAHRIAGKRRAAGARSTGASSTPSPSPSATACRSRRCRR